MNISKNSKLLMNYFTKIEYLDDTKQTNQTNQTNQTKYIIKELYDKLLESYHYLLSLKKKECTEYGVC
jgi:hypothetical protein